MAKGGGVRQRLGLNKQKLKHTRSALGGFFSRLYQRGALSSAELQDGASAASSSAPEFQRLTKRKVAYRVRRGKVKPDTRNAARAVKRLFRSRAILQSPLIVDVPLWDAATNQQVIGKLNIMPPHEFLDAIVAAGKEDEFASLDKSQAGLRLDLAEWASRVGVDLGEATWLMLALWGDAAPMTHNNSRYLLTVRVLSGKHRQRFWIAALSKKLLCQCGCFGRCTFDAIWEVVAWSCCALVAGEWPRTDHRQRPLQGWRAKKAGTKLSFKAAVVAKCGDWSWHKQFLGMRAV